MNNKVCVVVPVYRTELPDFEFRSLVNCMGVFAGRDVFAVYPQSLDLDQLVRRHTSFERLKRIETPDCMFGSVVNYSRLCTSPFFYDAFRDYEYMLIAQTDTWVFRDDLDRWCGLGYDYVGAPWCHMCRQCEKPRTDRVGNGGLSLRRVRAFADGLRDGMTDFFPEDLQVVRQLGLKIPDCATACEFALENMAFRHVMAGCRPMGLHNVQNLDPDNFGAIFEILDAAKGNGEADTD